MQSYIQENIFPNYFENSGNKTIFAKYKRIYSLSNLCFPIFCRILFYRLKSTTMEQGLDKIDYKILSQLQRNSRLTVKELAALVQLSPSPVFERMKRLEREGYIKKYIAVLNAEKIEHGFIAFCYISMKQHSFENAQRIMKAVQDIPEIVECYNISGDYDFLLKIYTKDMKHYQQFVLRILGEMDCIGSLNSSFVLGEVKNSHQLPLE